MNKNNLVYSSTKMETETQLIKKRKTTDYQMFEMGQPLPFDTIGLFTYLRTYARRHDEEDPNSTIESWAECIQRVVTSCNTQLRCGFTDVEMREIYNLLYNLKCSVAGRFLWQLGTRTVDRLGLPSLQNCSFTVVNSPITPFVWAMNFLMLGSGTGYRILPEDVDKLPIVKYALVSRKDTKDADFIVPDSREGWIKLLGKVLKAHFYSGQNFTYSCTLLRSKGAPIKSFGGVASGPEVLCDGMDKISSVLNKRAGQKLRPVDALDIMNIIGMIVVSGNVRRSAQLAIGDCKDKEFLNAKNWGSGNVPNWRAFSNNSVVCNDINDIIDNEEFWKGYDGSGEPYGLINLKLSRSCGRLGETQYPDSGVDGYNPCFSGETLIAVADGRGAVPIKQLVEEDKDVPVYSMDPETREVSIQWGRNPRVTGENQKLLRVHFGNQHKGQFVDVTPNHRFFTTDGKTLTAEELKKGDSIPIFEKNISTEGYLEVFTGSTTKKSEHRLIKEFYEPEKFQSKSQKGKNFGCCKVDGIVVHHKDENKTNNRPENLEILSASEHSSLHGVELVGEKNPMYGRKHSDETKTLIGLKTKERCSDPSFLKKLSESHTPELRQKYAETMKNVRYNESVAYSIDLEEKCEKAGLKTVRVSDTVVNIVRECEACGEEFLVEWSKRGQSYCSVSCGNTKKESIEARAVGIRKINEEKSKANFHQQVMIYKRLQEGGDVIQKQWKEECMKAGVPHRFQTKTPNPYIAKNWSDFKQRADDYNHTVLRVEELPGTHTVYNITIEKNHTMAVVTKTDQENLNLSGVYFFNCAEQSLAPWESCCLSECYLPNIKSKEELFTCVKYLYRICKHSLTLPCDSKETEQIVHQNMRMGIGVTGYLQATDEQRSWLSDCYKFLREFDKAYSIQNGFPTSIKLTTCKPSGSLSLLGGCTSGVHPGFSQYYKRRIRISSDSPLIAVAKKHGYPVEYSKNFDGTFDHRTQIITFPHRLPEGTVLAENCTAVDQLEWVKKLQTEWSDNSVSVTVYYRKHELPLIKEWLKKNYNNSVKTVSFLLHSDHGFIQAPMEAISKQEYEELASQCTPITDLEGICYHEEKMENLEGCGPSGACPLR